MKVSKIQARARLSSLVCEERDLAFSREAELRGWAELAQRLQNKIEEIGRKGRSPDQETLRAYRRAVANRETFAELCSV
jgi:hypothetical protein